MPFPAILATAFSCACHSCQGIARTRKHSQVLRQHLREQCCNHMDGVMILQAIGDALMDEHNVAQVARPGTSLTRPATGAAAVSQNRLAGAAAHNMQALQSAIACTLHGRAVGSVIAGVHMAFISKCCAQLTPIHHRPAQDMNRRQHDQHVCRLDLPLQRSCRWNPASARTSFVLHLVAGWRISCNAADVISRAAHHRFCAAQHKLSTAKHRQQRQPTHSTHNGPEGSTARHWGGQQASHVIWEVCMLQGHPAMILPALQHSCARSPPVPALGRHLFGVRTCQWGKMVGV
jgi:hypothetical protein